MRRLAIALGVALASLGGAASALPCSPPPPGIGEVRDVHVDADAAGRAFVTWDRRGEAREGERPRAVALGSGGSWAWADPVDAPAAAAIPPGLSYPQTLGGVTPAVGLGAGGHAVAVWRVVDTDADNPTVRRRAIQAVDRSPDGTWSPEYTLAGPDTPDPPTPFVMCSFGGDEAGPAVAVDGAGNAVAAWVARDPEPTGKVLMWAARPAGGAWSTPVIVGPPAEQLGLAVDASGTTAMTWIAGGRLRAAVRPAGGTFGSPDDLGPAVGSRPGYGVTRPTVTFDAAGRALAVWAAYHQVFAATRPAGGSWTAAVDLSRIAENPPPLISDVRLSRQRLRTGAIALSFRMRSAGEVLVTVRRKGRGPAVRGVKVRAARGLNRIVLLRRPLRPGAYAVQIKVRAKDWAPASRSARVVVLPRV